MKALQLAKTEPVTTPQLRTLTGSAARLNISARRLALDSQNQSVTMAKLEMAEPVLLQTTLRRIDVDTLMAVAVDAHVRNTGNVFHQPPERRSGDDTATELLQHLDAVASRLASLGTTEIRTRRAADDAIESPRNWMKKPDITAINDVRPTNNTESLSLKSPAKQVNARKQAQNQ
nr:hypothetical protein [Chromobacterium violaceum]